MSNSIVGGHITVTIGTSEITLTTENISASPKVFSLPAGEKIDISLGDLNKYLNDKFGIPEIKFDGISQTTLSISKFYISSAGIFDIAVNFVFGQGEGWDIFPGFKLNEVGFEVNYAKVPIVNTLTPNTGKIGDAIVVSGNDLASPSKILFGTIEAPLASVTNPTPAGFTVPVPAGLAAGAAPLIVTNVDGSSGAVTFTVTA